MMIPNNPGVLDRLIRDRQSRLASTALQRAQAHRRGGLRVRIGHLLIAVGATLSGERVELPARPPALPRTA